MNTEDVLDYASGIFQGIPVVTRYMRERALPLVQGLADPPERDIRLRALYERAFLWMQSLEQLSHAQDFQGIVTCNRALFELTVDLILLSEGGPIHTPERMCAWEQSAKLKAAEATVSYYAEAGRSVPDKFGARVDFIRRKKREVENQRQTFWSSKHPPRWTGHGLSVDAKRADELRAREISEDLDTSLLEFYETQMRRMHMTVHGSALALEHYLSHEGFHVICVLAYKWSTDLAVFCTKLILTVLGFSTQLPELTGEWAKVKADRLVIYEHYRPNLSSDKEFEE